MSDQNGDIFEEEMDQINKKLRQKGILTNGKELIENLDSLIPESKNPKKFVDDINK